MIKYNIYKPLKITNQVKDEIQVVLTLIYKHKWSEREAVSLTYMRIKDHIPFSRYVKICKIAIKERWLALHN